MSETPTNDGKNKMLSLRNKSSTVRQSFSHGRSKSVVVETKRKRLLVPLNTDKNIQTSDPNKQSSEKTSLQNRSAEKKSVTDIEVNRRIKALENAKAVETSKIEQEKIILAAREKELKELRKKKNKEENDKQSLNQKTENITNNIDQNLAGPLPSQIPLADAPVT